MSLGHEKSIVCRFDQFLVANFGAFQMVVPTKICPVRGQKLNGMIPVQERVYASQGWILTEGESVVTLKALELGAIGTENTPFQISPRIAPGVPINFEVRSEKPLPSSLLAQAIFACQIPEQDQPFLATFRGLSPRFTRIYDMRLGLSAQEVVAEMLTDEANFIADHQAQLQSVPFYRDHFDL